MNNHTTLQFTKILILIIVENSFQIAPDDSEPEILENRPEVWDRDTKFLSVSDQILYLDNRNLIVLDYKPTYENNKP